MAANPREPGRLVTEIAELFPRQKEWTEEDYFALPETNRFIELSDGELIMPPHPTSKHQRAVGRLFVTFFTYVEQRDLGIVAVSPLPVRLWPGKVREPDLLFISNAHADRMHEQYCDPPDLVVEVFSPSTRRADEIEKFEEYARAGIPEYWHVDTEARKITVFVLENGAYRLFSEASAGGSVKSRVLAGFTVSADEIFKA